MEPARPRRNFREELPLMFVGPLLVAIGVKFARIFRILAGLVFSICALKRPPRLVHYWTCFECGDEKPGPSAQITDSRPAP